MDPHYLGIRIWIRVKSWIRIRIKGMTQELLRLKIELSRAGMEVQNEVLEGL
jgi:hypothetical protein